MDASQLLADVSLMPVVTIEDPSAAVPLAQALLAGGIRAIEVTLRTEHALEAMQQIATNVPGILPVSNVAQTRKFAKMCGAEIPAWMNEIFEGLDDHPAARQLIAATVAAELCRKLYAGGERNFHFYTLNRAELSYAICHLLGKRQPKLVTENAA